MKRFNIPPLSFLLFTLLGITGLSQAEVITVPIGQQTGSHAVELPNRHSSMDAVRARFGEPENQSGPKGEPPITTWYYREFTVYFEYQHVVHSVVKHQRKDQ